MLKDEQLTEAVQRVAKTKLGCEVEIRETFGVFEHFYETSEIDDVDSKHYVANAFLVEPIEAAEQHDESHSELHLFSPPFENFHPYIERYLEEVTWDKE